MRQLTELPHQVDSLSLLSKSARRFASQDQLTISPHHVGFLSWLAKLPDQVACLSPFTMSAPQFNKPSRLFKYAHQATPQSRLNELTLLSPLTKLTYHLASASWLGSPSCPTQSPLEVCSPCRLSSSAHQAQGGSTSELFKYTDEVVPLSSLTKSARQVGSPIQLAKAKSSHPVDLPSCHTINLLPWLRKSHRLIDVSSWLRCQTQQKQGRGWLSGYKFQ